MQIIDLRIDSRNKLKNHDFNNSRTSTVQRAVYLCTMIFFFFFKPQKFTV